MKPGTLVRDGRSAIVAALFATAYATPSSTARTPLASPSGSQSVVDTSCSAAAAFVIKTIEDNYAGIADKVAAAGFADYVQRRGALRGMARDAVSRDECLGAIGFYLFQFRDRNLAVATTGSSAPSAGDDTAAIRARFANEPRREMTDSQAILAASRPGADPIEGVWDSMTGAGYHVAIVRDSGGAFTGVVTRSESAWWVTGQIKVRFRKSSRGYDAVFGLRDHTQQGFDAVIYDGNVLDMTSDFVRAIWLRAAPVRKGDLTRAEYSELMNASAGLRRLDTALAVLHLPSFAADQAHAIDSLANALRSNPARLLLVDVRGNGGGSDAVWRTVAALPSTARTAILADRGCIGSCEEFVVAACRNPSVTLYGDNTGGAADYSNVVTVPVPGQPLALSYPTARSLRLPGDPIDPLGIQPHVRLDAYGPQVIGEVADRLRSGAAWQAGKSPESPTAGRVCR